VQADHSWVVTFIGANINVTQAAHQLNIPVSNTASQTASAASTRRAFAGVSSCSKQLPDAHAGRARRGCHCGIPEYRSSPGRDFLDLTDASAAANASLTSMIRPLRPISRRVPTPLNTTPAANPA
jgi:hypothetical protein